MSTDPPDVVIAGETLVLVPFALRRFGRIWDHQSRNRSGRDDGAQL